MERIFTFGFGQTDPRTAWGLANRYVRVDAATTEQARYKMVERFGSGHPGGSGNWAFDYPDEEAAGVDRFGLIEIDFNTGIDISWPVVDVEAQP